MQENGHISCMYKIYARSLQVFHSKSKQGTFKILQVYSSWDPSSSSAECTWDGWSQTCLKLSRIANSTVFPPAFLFRDDELSLAWAENFPDEVEDLELVAEVKVEERAGSDCEAEPVDEVDSGGVGLSDCKEWSEGDRKESDWFSSSRLL